jgi:hypothetical protein
VRYNSGGALTQARDFPPAPPSGAVQRKRFVKRARPVPTQETGLIVVNAKKLLGLAAIALVLFFVIAQPGHAAGLVNNSIQFLRDAAESVITFVSNIFR